eukprot:scaffold2589_cov147-Amphora_coffeaeformis.AAC.6
MRSENIWINVSVETPSTEYDFVAVRGSDDFDAVAGRVDADATWDDVFALENVSWAVHRDEAAMRDFGSGLVVDLLHINERMIAKATKICVVV